MPRTPWQLLIPALAACCLALSSCKQPAQPPATSPAVAPALTGPLIPVRLNPQPVPTNAPASEIESARNQTVGFAFQLTAPRQDKTRRKYWLRFHPLKSPAATIDPARITLYQVLPLPLDTNRAAYVRQTGLPTGARKLPAVLLPLSPDEKGRFQLAQLRDNDQPTKPADPKSPIADPVQLWVDVQVPSESHAGQYEGSIELVHDYWGDKVDATLPIKLTVHDFVLPDERHLLLVAPLNWETLYNRWPNEFEAITPRLLNRDEAKHSAAVRVLDQLVKEGQRHRVQVICPRLQPTVKWAPGRPPQFDWLDYDTVVSPWLTGDAFPDKVPLGYWPLPKVDQLDRYERSARMEFWKGAAAHFDQHGWLTQSSVLMDPPASRFLDARVRAIGDEAGEILHAHSRLRVTAPIPADLLPVAERPTPGRVDITDAQRVTAYAPGLVYGPAAEWPAAFVPPKRFLAVDMGAPIPYIGVGQSESDVRHWAWLAFLQRADMILFNEPIPHEASPNETAAGDEQVWFYPGAWFGVDGVLPTLQLKWARTAANDYEYLSLAKQRGETASPELAARLLSRPVETRPGQSPDPVYSLVSGATGVTAWDDARRLVARAIELRQPGQAPDPALAEKLRLETIQWEAPRARPTVMVRDVKWSWAKGAGQTNRLDARLAVDLYLAAEDQAQTNSVGFTTVPPGWEVDPRPTELGPLAMNKVTRVNLDARFDLDRAGLTSTAESEVRFVGTGGYTRDGAAARFVLPVATSERREGALKLDGTLADWNPADAIQDGPLVRMFNRPALQSQTLQRAATPTSLYTAWGEESFYVAFKLQGLSTSGLAQSRNFVEYQDRRAWGEDLCELLLQAVYTDGATGPVVHVVCKPNGQWVERKSTTIVPSSDPWTPAPEGILYAGKLDPATAAAPPSTSPGATWRGELAIPWRLLNDPRRGRPSLLRFNFAQHKSSTGESSSFAGPIDHGRDESLMAILLLKDTTR